MRHTQSTVVLMVLLVGAFAAPGIKTRLGQVSAKNLAQADQAIDCPPLSTPPILTLPECPCNFSELPGLGNGVSQGFEQRAEASQVATLTAVPDTAFTQICQSNCCECAESVHASLASASKNRTFTLSGSISVLEEVYFSEESSAAENSKAREQKDTICITNNQNGGLGSSPDCVTVTTCNGTSNVGLGSISH